MKLSAYIEMLQGALEKHGDLRVAITQSGYYADGQFADLHDPVEVDSLVVRGSLSGWSGGSVVDTREYEDFIVLGHSSQNY